MFACSLMPSIFSWSVLFGVFWTVTVSAARLDCECGYAVNDTDASFALFTDLFESDFLHLYNIPDSIDVPANQTVGWSIQAYNVSPNVSRGPYGKMAEVENVVLNPLAERKDWHGEGTLGGPPGIQLWVRNEHDLAGEPGEEMVRGSEINSLRKDMRYGSFRIGMRMSYVAGTCAAFFWYRNNTQEIDLEYLSKQSNNANGTHPINLVIQSPASESANYDAAGTSTFRVISLPFTPSSGYHEYRFDWTPESIVFFADGDRIAEFESDTDSDAPDAPGTLMLNHWSNGDDGWSGGPPATDAVLTVSYVKAYFNSSNATREAQWRNSCENNWINRTCQVPVFPAEGIDPLQPVSAKAKGVDKNKNFFFMYQGKDAVVNQTMYPAATAEKVQSKAALMSPPRYWMISVWMALFAVFAVGLWL